MNQTADERMVDVRLKLPDAQLILNALSGLPYREVSQLIPDLMAQIQAQLQGAVSEARKRGVEEQPVVKQPAETKRA